MKKFPPCMKMSPPLIRSDSISLIHLLCGDIPAAMAFYVGQLGFEVKCDEEVNGERFLVVSSVNLVSFAPECSLRFRAPTTERDHQILSMGPPTGLMLTVETDDFDQVMGKLTSFGTATQMRTNRKEGYRAVTLMDPMGNQVILCDKTTRLVGRVFVKDVGH
jgi:catechol 2,3-dioxygenase-like lactoylglutathione lyase family enzyme